MTEPKRDEAMSDGFRVEAMLRLNDGAVWDGECIIPRGKVSGGYKRIWLRGFGWRAHRLAYAVWVGGLLPCEDENGRRVFSIDHLCRNKLCINPSHLEQVTLRENIFRSESPPAQNARKILCENGHPLVHRNGTNWRFCPVCKKERRQFLREQSQ